MTTNRQAAIRTSVLLMALFAVSSVLAPALWAGGTGTNMPWNTPGQTLVDNLTGPTARWAIATATAICGIKWMFRGHEHGGEWLSRVLIGGPIVLAAQLIVSYARFGGALL